MQVKRYVLPKFKVAVSADKSFYLPKETVKLELQSDYFFGKPVANAKVEVTASTFDVAFNQFHSWKGATDSNGHAKLEIKLPDHFVGQPLQKGDALVKLDVKVIDTADHSEAVAKTYPVSDQPVRISLIAEGGKIVPNMDNRIFVAATYPDGSPAPNCEIKLTHEKPDLPPAPGAMKPVKQTPLGKVKTNAAGLAEFKVKPHADQLRVGNWGQRDIEMLGGKHLGWGPQILFDVLAVAKDAKGNTAAGRIAVNSQPLGENVLLRLDKAIYQAGDRITIDVRSSAGMPIVYVDIVRGGQIMLSKWLEVKDGKAVQTLDLPQTVFGSLEIHAYQMLQQGEIIRDSRVVYVQPRNDLKVTVQPGKAEFAPGEDAMIRFQVTDALGKPTAAAIGVIIVDEAVYALQEMQPGLEKVYFTLQEELLKPRAEIKLGPGDTMDNLVRQPALPAPRQQVAEVLLAAVQLPAPKRFAIAPQQERKQRLQAQVEQIGGNLLFFGLMNEANVLNKAKGRWVFRAGALDELVKQNYLPPKAFDNLAGGELTLDDLVRLHPGFTAAALAETITAHRMRGVLERLEQYTLKHRDRFFKEGRLELPADLLKEMVAENVLSLREARDAWCEPLRLVRLDRKTPNPSINDEFDEYEIVSSGPDRKMGTADDMTTREACAPPRFDWGLTRWWLPANRRAEFAGQRPLDQAIMRRAMPGGGLGGFGGLGGGGNPMGMFGMAGMAVNPGGAGMFGMGFGLGGGAGMFGMGGGLGGFNGGFGGFGGGLGGFGGGLGGFGGGGFGGGMFGMMGAGPPPPTPEDSGVEAAVRPTRKAPRIREYFPETMVWQPALITDEKGQANLALSFADSITTWRLSASANSKAGALGGATVPLKVFQDFFVDIDLPVHLTQGDEIAFPVAVYNYLKTPQTVKIELQKEAWFELLDQAGLVRSLDLKPNEVTSVKFRIRAGKLGMQPLTVKALGAKRSDAVKRLIDVAPNGQRVETVASGRLQGKISQRIDIPDYAVPDASKLLVKIYPGAMAQVVEGLDGMLRMPNGCFEQTSSSAYPNVLIVDYIKKNRLTSPQMLMRAEELLNVGYQRLLVFERPGGGFDWWGHGEPLIWLSAYGLQEFNDMARVYPIDRGIIERTQAFLLKKMDAGGTWSNIGATHGETIASMGNARLLLTSYVTWSLLESGYDRKALDKSVQFIRDGVKKGESGAYVMALAANALAAYDAKDDSTLAAVRQLDKLHQEVPDWKAIRFPATGMSLTYAHGDSVTVETTALAVLAMEKTGQFTSSVNQALTYLVKAKQANGTWGSTQATILALKALLNASGGSQQKGTTHFTIRVDGQEAARGKVDAENADVMQTFDLKGLGKAGAHQVEIDVKGESCLLYQVVGRYHQPWPKHVTADEPVFDLGVSYDRTKLSTSDRLHAKATLIYRGKLPTYMVMLELGIAPGFSVDPGDFAEMVDKNRVKKFEVTARQVILYLGDVRPGDELHFEYTLRAHYPLRAKTPAAVAYEYNTPANRTQAAPVELTVEEKK